jgi:geranylgeranyl pyrophosphate synthase
MASQFKMTLDSYSALVEERLREHLPPSPGNLLAESVWYHLDTGGKRLRPILCLISCDALGGDIQSALDFAAATELLHNMLLIHDDIEDGDEFRRDRPTVWVRYGIPHAINAGDYLLGAAYAAVLRTPGPVTLKARLVDIFNDTYLRTVEGQALDIATRAAKTFSLDQYRRMVEMKTGYYLALGMVGGAVIAGADDDTIARLWKFGRCAGPAFQIRDDVLDLTAAKGRGGKVGSDIEEGKASILYAHALEHTAPPDAERLRRIMLAPRHSTTPEDVGWVIDLYHRSGAMEFAGRYSEDLIREAQEQVRFLPLKKDERLTDLVQYLIERES